MKRLILFAFVVLLAGCHGDDDGVDHDAVRKAQAPYKAAAVRAGGDWSKLSPDEQKLFLDKARGNENAARSMVGMMGGTAPGGPKKGG